VVGAVDRLGLPTRVQGDLPPSQLQCVIEADFQDCAFLQSNTVVSEEVGNASDARPGGTRLIDIGTGFGLMRSGFDGAILVVFHAMLSGNAGNRGDEWLPSTLGFDAVEAQQKARVYALG